MGYQAREATPMRSFVHKLYRRYSPTVWLLTVGRLVDQTTLWMAMPFMAIFINRAGASASMTGLVLALNQKYGFLGEVEGAPLTGHLTLGLLGWFSLMIVSAGLKLLPMFAPAKVLPARLVAATGAGLTVGVLLILAGLWLGRFLEWLGALLVAAALVAYVAQIGYAYLRRRTGPLDFSVRFGVTSGFVMLLPVAILPWASRQGQAGLVFLFGLGFVGGTILGMLLRIIPFMVWLHRFRNRTHKLEKIPFLHELFQRRLGWVGYLTWFPAAGLMAAGIGFASPPLVEIGAVAGLAGLGAYAAAVRQIIHHVKPGTPPLFPGPARQ
jgi:hypothetical protein